MKRAILLIATICLLGSPVTKATHIIGGEWSIQWVSGTTYHIRLNHYRDCTSGNADFQTPIPVALYDKVTNTMVDSFCMTLQSRNTLTLGDSCYTPNVCTQLGIYDTTLSLPSIPNGFYIAYSRCCRNGIITNITNPGAAAEVWYAEYPNTAIHDALPVFDDDLPKGYMCANLPNSLNFHATDADGDSLVYSLITPLNGNLTTTTVALSSACAPPVFASKALPDPGPYPPVNWSAGYSDTNMIGGNPAMAIDQHGILTANPPNLGVFVFCIRVEEYRGGVKLGEVRKDVQYDVLPCAGTPPSITTSPLVIHDTIIAGNTESFKVLVPDSSALDSLFLYGIGSGKADLFTNGSNTIFKQPDTSIISISDQFTFNSVCSDTGTYHIKFLVIKHRCFAVDSAVYNLDITVILPPPTPVPGINISSIYPPSPPYVIAAGDSVSFNITVSDTSNNTLYLTGNGPLLNGGYNVAFTQPDSGKTSVSQTFKYVSSCSDIKATPYQLVFTGNGQKNYLCSAGGATTDTVNITVTPPPGTLLDSIPNIFTPNGDHKNDSLSLYHETASLIECWTNFHIEIFNRWGESQFESTDVTFSWDGKNKSGTKVSEGVYYYIITADFLGKPVNKRGTVNVKM